MTKPQFSHLDAQGRASMVDIAAKPTSHRIAKAEALMVMKPAVLKAVIGGTLGKGDALAAARIAGIQAAKKTAELIPLCHPLSLSSVKIDIVPEGKKLAVRAEVKLNGQTGAEMEALTAVSVACLTLYDMAKSADRAMMIESIKLVEKRGGKSGTYKAAK